MRSRTNSHDQEGMFITHRHRPIPNKAKGGSLVMDVYINEEKEIFRLEREFSCEIPYASVHAFMYSK